MNKFDSNIEQVKSDKNSSKKILKMQALTGIVAGFINGLFGGGGGMVLIPMLTRFLKLTQKEAHATAILIILPLSVLSALTYILFGKLNISIGFPVMIGVVGGGVVGTFLLKKLSTKIVTIIFYIFMATAGIKMLVG